MLQIRSLNFWTIVDPCGLDVRRFRRAVLRMRKQRTRSALQRGFQETRAQHGCRLDGLGEVVTHLGKSSRETVTNRNVSCRFPQPKVTEVIAALTEATCIGRVNRGERRSPYAAPRATCVTISPNVCVVCGC